MHTTNMETSLETASIFLLIPDHMPKHDQSFPDNSLSVDNLKKKLQLEFRMGCLIRSATCWKAT
jgi:hypothetical protein